MEILRNPKAFTGTLLLYAYDKLGDKLFEYEPEIIEVALKRNKETILRSNADRLHAGVGLLKSDLFWQDPTVFGLVCRTLNRRRDPINGAPDLSDICWGVQEAGMIYPTDENGSGGTNYSDSIIRYIRYMLKQEGLVEPPEILSFVTIPMPKRTLDDPEMLLSIQQNTMDNNAEYDGEVSAKTAEWLYQVKELGIGLSEQAGKDLEEVLSGYTE